MAVAVLVVECETESSFAQTPVIATPMRAQYTKYENPFHIMSCTLLPFFIRITQSQVVILLSVFIYLFHLSISRLFAERMRCRCAHPVHAHTFGE